MSRKLLSVVDHLPLTITAEIPSLFLNAESNPSIKRVVTSAFEVCSSTLAKTKMSALTLPPLMITCKMRIKNKLGTVYK